MKAGTRRYKFKQLALASAASMLLASCGGGDSSGTTTISAANLSSATPPLVKISAETAGGNCAVGGSRIDAGLDNNANGVLDSAEIKATQYVCNGAIGLVGAVGATGATGASGITGATGGWG